MKYLILLALLAFTQARIINDNNCDHGVVIHNIKHEKEILKEGIDSPYQLVIDYDTNTLFYSYTAYSGDDIFRSAYLNLKTNNTGDIPGISGGFANAVDDKNHIVYLGGRDGIYKFDFETKTAKKLDGTDHNIWQMFYKDGLFYTNYPDEKVYMYNNGESTMVEALRETKAMLVAVDNNKNLYFSNSSGLFCYKRAKGKIFKLGEYNINGFASNINGDLYFSTNDAIYYINENQKQIEQLVTIENIYGLAIEGDNSIIYAANLSIVRLRPTATICFGDEIKKTFENNNL